MPRGERGLLMNVTSRKGMHKIEDKNSVSMNKTIKLLILYLYLIFGGVYAYISWIPTLPQVLLNFYIFR